MEKMHYFHPHIVVAQGKRVGVTEFFVGATIALGVRVAGAIARCTKSKRA